MSVSEEDAEDGDRWEADDLLRRFLKGATTKIKGKEHYCNF